MIDYTISIGNISEIASIVIGGLAVMIRMNNNLISIKSDVVEMQKEITKLGEVLIKMAVTDTRVAAADERIANLERDIRELRHGEGFVRGRLNRSVDGEY